MTMMLKQVEAHGSLLLPPPWSDEGGSLLSSLSTLSSWSYFFTLFTLPSMSSWSSCPFVHFFPLSRITPYLRKNWNAATSPLRLHLLHLPLVHQLHHHSRLAHLSYKSKLGVSLSQVLRLWILSSGLTANNFTTKQVKIWQEVFGL